MAAGSLRPNIVRVMTEHREGWLVLIPGPCGMRIDTKLLIAPLPPLAVSQATLNTS